MFYNFWEERKVCCQLTSKTAAGKKNKLKPLQAFITANAVNIVFLCEWPTRKDDKSLLQTVLRLQRRKQTKKKISFFFFQVKCIL